MEMNLKTLNAQAISSTTETKKMGMSDDAQAIVFQMFTENIYSNAIGTVVREITSNCFDSHVEAGVNAPVVIRKIFDKLDNCHYISFIDYGVGMSPDRIENIYGMYFKSTKRSDNTQIGGFGIGGKTPLAYKRSTGFSEGEYDNSFNIITNYNGIKYGYCIFSGDDAPGIAPLFNMPTTDANGTEVRIPVLEKDIQTFAREMVMQLYYFENIVFEGFDELDNEHPTNEYQIVRGKSFLFRGDDYNDNVHVCLGKVAYPIDYSVLGLNPYEYKLPVAIRLEIGEIGVIPSRESLKYSEATIKILKAKLLEVKAEIVQLLSKQYESIVTLEDYFKVKNNFGKLYFPNGESIEVDIIKQKDIDFSNFKYNFTKMPNDKQLFRLFFETKIYGKKPKSRYRYNDETEQPDFVGGYDTLINKNHNLYFINDEFERKIVKQAFLKEKHATYYMFEIKELADTYNATVISNLFNVDDKIVNVDANGVSTPTAFIKNLKKMQEEYFEIVRRQCTDYDTLEVPQEFIDARKHKGMSEEIKKMTIPVKIFGSYEANTRVKLEAMFKLNVPIYYGVKENDYELKHAQRMFAILFDDNNIVKRYSEETHTFSQNGKKGIMFVRVSQGNLKYMQMCKQARPIKEFNTKIMHRKADEVIEYFQGQELISKFQYVPDLYKSKGFKTLAPAWAERINAIEELYIKLNTPKKHGWSGNKYELAQHYQLDIVTYTKEQKHYVKMIDELQKMVNLNNNTLEYINIPYRLDNKEYHGDGELKVFWDIISKVLVY